MTGGRPDDVGAAVASPAARRAGRRLQRRRRRRRRRRRPSRPRRRATSASRPRRLHRRRHGGEQREDRAADRPRRRRSTSPTAAEVDGRCIFVRPRSVASGLAASLIPQGWPNPEVNGEPPVIWSPAASALGRHRQRSEAGAELAPPARRSCSRRSSSPCPSRWPRRWVGRTRRSASPTSCRWPTNPEGWGAVGHPEWGPFRLGKTNPNFSTSGLNFTIAEYYAADRQDAGPDDRGPVPPGRRRVRQPDRVVGRALRRHHDDVPQQLVRRRRAATPSLTYTSVVAVEEKSVIDYNLGNPDGVLSPGEEPRVPRDPLVAIYPKEGTLYSDSPFIVLDTRVGRRRRAGGRRAVRGLRAAAREPAARCWSTGSGRTTRPSPLADPIVAANGVDPTQPTAELEVPSPEVLIGILDSWAELRKDARVLLVLDISGSMGEIAERRRRTRLDLAQEAAVSALDQFKDTDDVGLWVFSTDLGGRRPERPRAGADRADRRATGGARRGDRSPVPDERHAALRRHRAGVHDDARRATTRRRSTPSCCSPTARTTTASPDDDDQQFAELIEPLQPGSEGSSARSRCACSRSPTATTPTC